MGMEVNGVAAATSYQSQITQAAKPVAKTSNSTTNTNNDVVSESSQSSVSSMAVSIGQAAESEQSGNNAYKKDEPSKKEQKQASSMGEVKDINKLINNNTVAEFSYNEPTKRIAIKIKDKDTDEVIKEIPSEKALEMLAKAWELAGLLVDEKR